jgi:2-alkyl-3-oxoalkanoate reductase
LKRVVVIGGNGFIGERVVAALKASDWAQPVVASRRRVLKSDGVEHVQVDATDGSALTRALGNAAGVVNCVTGDAATIVANARALFAAAAGCTPQPRVVYLSSMAVYGTATGDLDESAPTVVEGSPYGVAKVAAEKVAATYARAVVLRPGIVYGPHSDWWSVEIARLLGRRRLGDLGPMGEGVCNLLYVDDMAKATLQALRLPNIEGCTFNVAMALAPTWNDYFALYAQALGAAPVSHISPARLAVELRLLGPALRALDLAAHAAHLPFRPPAAIRPWLIQLTAHRLRLDVSAAERQLQMTWTPLAEALRTTSAVFLSGRQASNKR